MSLESDLNARSGSLCELCSSSETLEAYEVPPVANGSADQALLICGVCSSQIGGTASLDNGHWQCLNDSMWSQVPAVQVMAWRMLNRLKNDSWADDALEMLYLDEETLEWAQSGAADTSDEEIQHRDSNGAILSAGDTVVLIKDLNVKGAGFTAKRGTAVRSISVVHDNAAHIEGRVNGQQIVILTEFVKKSG
jgi:protein PhnA